MSKANDIATYGQYAPKRTNIIINGGFTVTQRGTTFTGLTANAYTLDRWLWASTAGETVNVTQSPNLNNETHAHYINVNVTVADVSIGITDTISLIYRVEGFDAIPIGWNNTNQSAKKDITLSFWTAHVKTGTYCVSFRNSASDRSYVAEYTQAVSGTWEKHTITIPAPTDGTWLIDNGIGMNINFTVAAGTNFQTSNAETWEAANYIATTNQVNGVDSTANNFRIMGVQLEVGTEATDFEFRHFGDELALCQRYYEKSYDIDVAPGTITTSGFWNFYLSGIATLIHATAAYIHLAVPKRANTYTLIAYSDATGDSGKLRDSVGPANDITPTLDGQGTGSFRIVATGKSANAISISGHWTCDAEL